MAWRDFIKQTIREVITHPELDPFSSIQRSVAELVPEQARQDVQALIVAMQYPAAASTLEIRSVSLSKTDPGDAVLEGKPLVDEFGQYTRLEWPGKAHSLEDLHKAWTAEAESLKSAPTNRCQYGGFLGTSAKATGFFRVEKVDDRWWFVCPDGHLFYSSGLNGVGTGAGTRVQGREDLFAKLPPVTPGPGRRGGSFCRFVLHLEFAAPPW